MYSWLIFSLVAAFIWAVVNIIDKIIVSRYIDKVVVYLVFTGLTSLLGIGLSLFFKVQILSTSYLILALSTGILYQVYTYLFFRALQISDASSVANMLLLVPVFSVIVGRFFFHELFQSWTYVGIFLVLVGVLGASWEVSSSSGPGLKRGRITPALGLMTLSAVLTTIDYSFQKAVLMVTTDMTLFLWSRVGVFLATILILILFRSVVPSMKHTIKSIPRIIMPIVVGNSIIDMVATFALMAAYSVGALGLVTTSVSTQPVFVLLLVILLNRIKPKLVPSKAEKEWFFLRFMAMAITIVGVYLIGRG
jgi:drug/metabolite transporter (DMT)-like permease